MVSEHKRQTIVNTNQDKVVHCNQ